MSTSAEFTDYVLDQLYDVGVIQTSKKFGGVMLKVNNKQLGVIIAGTLYFKVKEPELQERFEKLDSYQYEYIAEGEEEPVVVKSLWSVPMESLENKRKVVGLAYEVLLQGK